jgi:aminopeptidase N
LRKLDEQGLVLRPSSDSFEVGIVNRIRPAANTALMGLYLSNGSLFTQCEAEGFRRITYFPDRPDVMTKYRVTLRADRQSFGAALERQSGRANRPGQRRHQAIWEDPFAKPSYLFAVVAGRFAALEHRWQCRSGRSALLQVWVEPGNLDRTRHAMSCLVNAIAWDESRYGLELDLDRFMIVASNDFNGGAMENKGLNIFNAKYVLASPAIATDIDYARIESIVGHEYFHNWTGNRVTCRDWFQLSLKEGLTVFRDQQFTADMLEGPETPRAQAHRRRAHATERPSFPRMPGRWRIRCAPRPTRRSATSTPRPSTKRAPRWYACCIRWLEPRDFDAGWSFTSAATTARR